MLRLAALLTLLAGQAAALSCEQINGRTRAFRFAGLIRKQTTCAFSIPVPMARADAVDPEEALVASLSACHMLFFLALAAKAGFRVDTYVDDAVGVLGKTERGRTFMERITLRPKVTFSGETKPDQAAIDELHHTAHEHCFIANSLRSEIVIDPPVPQFV